MPKSKQEWNKVEISLSTTRIAVDVATATVMAAAAATAGLGEPSVSTAILLVARLAKRFIKDQETRGISKIAVFFPEIRWEEWVGDFQEELRQVEAELQHQRYSKWRIRLILGWEIFIRAIAALQIKLIALTHKQRERE